MSGNDGPTVEPFREQTLKGVRIFEQLSEADRGNIEQLCRWHRYAARDIIVHELDNSQDLFVVISGTVIAASYLERGHVVAYRTISDKEIFGEYSAIDGKPRSANVTALTDCLVASFPSSTFWEIIKAYPEIAQSFMVHLTTQLRILTSRVAGGRAHSVKERVLMSLLALAEAYPTGSNAARIDPVFTGESIASLADTGREDVSRLVSELRRQGIVSTGRPITIVDVAKLRLIVEDFA